jgi:hypothetical protein
MSLPYCDTKTASTHVNRHNNTNTVNNASNLSYSVKEEKQSNKIAKNNVHQYDNSVKTVHDQQLDMSPASQIKIEDQRFLNSKLILVCLIYLFILLFGLFVECIKFLLIFYIYLFL